MKKRTFLFFVISLFIFINYTVGQINTGGTPVSSSTIGLSDNFEVINLIPPDISQFTEEDIVNDENNFPQRIATNVPVNVDIQTSGTWEKIASGGKVWRIQLNCDGALAINVQFDAFYLPNGSNLFVYNEEKSQMLGAFTSINNNKDGLFSTELLGGEAVIVEYYEPEFTNELVELSISDIAYAYRNVSYVLENSEDFGDSDWCQVNVNCSPEGNNWQDEKRGVARILYKEGFSWYWCTGSLVNNTLENGTPYFLTADHCGGTASASDRNQWIFYFNYESTGCSNPGSSPGYNSKTGATLKARGDISGGSDFQLVQINGTIPAYYNVYYNGWDRSGSSSSSGVGIHHPAGDIKKISTYSSTLTSSTWYGSGYIGAANAHWRTSWIATTNGFGVSEGGSSGSPIFNSTGRILGTLTGGSTECNDPTWDYYGKFSYHWQSNGTGSSFQLEPWLDPNSSGVTYLDGWDPNAANPPVADFEADDTSPGAGQTVYFTDLSSENPTSWLWSFSPSTVTYVGGTNSSSQNPQVQFNNTGNYTVSLTSWNAYGSDSETKSNYINVSLFCDASGGANYMHISNVQMGTINNSSGQDYYANYTSLSTDLSQYQTGASITVANGAVYGDEDLGVWIDWNQDDDFYDTGENIVCEIDDDGQGTFIFDVPGTASLGTTTMRIRIKYSGSDCGDPCGTTTYGEVEDYSVNVLPGSAPPVADFEADNLTPAIGETVNFTDLSTNSPTTWQWSFSPSSITYVGGTHQNSPNPQVQFNTSGPYTVALSVSNPSGSDMEIKSNYITVTGPPVADFEADNLSPTIGETVNFTDLSTNNPTSWQWSFNPSTVTYIGGTNSNSPNPQVQFNAEGYYTVALTAYNASGSDMEIKTDYILAIGPPIADFEADNLLPLVGETVNFTDLSTNNPTTWQWSFSPSSITYVGGTNQNSQHPQVQFSAYGTYTVALSVASPAGSDMEIKTDYILVIAPPDANFEADNITPGISETVTFTDLSTNNPSSWAWSFTPSTVTYVGGTTSIDQNPQVTFDAAGYYTVELTATNVSGSDTETKIDYIFVANVPDADFEADNVTPGISETVNFTDLSTNNPSSWAWSFTPSTVTYVGGSTSTDQNPQVTFDAAGYYTVELTATNVSGSDTETKIDYIFVIDLPDADFEADNVSPGISETVTFTDLSTNNPSSWAWSFTPSTVTYVGGTTSIDQNPQVTFDAAGYYTVELTATNVSGGDTETKVDYIIVALPYIDLELTVYLEGPANGSLMNTDLLQYIPLNQPFNVTPWYYTGTESVVIVPGTDIVDWALVELRDAVSPDLAIASTTFDWQAAFIRNDGKVVDLNGDPTLHFGTSITDSLFIVVHHRNHLSIMSAYGLEEDGGIYIYDFSTAEGLAFGANAQKLIGTGIWGMFSGDGNKDKTIDDLDKSLIWENEAGENGYLESDYNLNGQSDNSDKNDFWFPNQGEGSQVPD